MGKPKFLLSIAILSLLVVPMLAMSDDPLPARMEFGGRDNTPDELVFDFLLALMATQYESNPDLALIIVRDKMRIGPEEEAEEFLRRMFAAREGLARTKKVVSMTVLCHHSGDRSKQQIYDSMDALDDARMILANYSYEDFLGTLEPHQQRFFKSWLDDTKEGYSYTAVDHATLYEEKRIDAKTHVERVCAKYVEEEAEVSR